MSGHTPGPWSQDPTGDLGWWYIGTPEKLVATVICKDGLTGLSTREARANARLIAAAPDLLAVLKSVEWEGQTAGAGRLGFWPSCPSCGAPAPSVGFGDADAVARPGVHVTGCVLAAAIAKAEPSK